MASASVESRVRPAGMILVRMHAPRQQPLRSIGIREVYFFVFDKYLGDGLLQLVILLFAGAIEIRIALIGRIRRSIIMLFSPRCVVPRWVEVAVIFPMIVLQFLVIFLRRLTRPPPLRRKPPPP